MITTSTTNISVSSANSEQNEVATRLANGEHCLGWALRLQPTSEHCYHESVSLEIQHILRHHPNALLTVLTLYNRTLYGGNNSSSQLTWEDQDVQISISYRHPSPTDLLTHSTALDDLQHTMRDHRKAVFTWAHHTHWHASSLPWEKTLQTAREWENVGTFHHPPTLRTNTYQLGSYAPTTTESPKLRIANRVWWDDVSQCFMVTECSYHDFSVAPDYENGPLEMSHQLIRNHCPCRHWILPTPLSSILIGVDDGSTPSAVNLQFGNRMAMVHAYDEASATWHPLLCSKIGRASCRERV